MLGENHAMVGFDTVQEMVLATPDDADKHLEMMVNFILAAKLDDELRAHDWAKFARGYNGPQHAKNGYHTILATAFLRWSRIKITPWSPNALSEEPAIILPETAPEPTPAPVGHNGGPALEPEHTSLPTPVDQVSKVVGGVKWGAIATALWTAIVASDVLPPAFKTPEFATAMTGVITLIAGAIGTYLAPKNAEPG